MRELSSQASRFTYASVAHAGTAGVTALRNLHGAQRGGRRPSQAADGLSASMMMLRHAGFTIQMRYYLEAASPASGLPNVVSAMGGYLHRRMRLRGLDFVSLERRDANGNVLGHDYFVGAFDAALGPSRINMLGLSSGFIHLRGRAQPGLRSEQVDSSNSNAGPLEGGRHESRA